MNKAGGFIVIHRKIADWEWYRDTNTFCLFIHILLAANYEDGRFEGKTIKRGQLVTSLASLAEETGLSIRQTRTALSHLISTGEVTNKSFTKYRIITVTNYSMYQDKRQTKRQTNDKQPTNKTSDNRQQYNNNNNINKETNKSLTRFIPPTLDEVTEYVKEIDSPVDPGYFFDHYESNGWILKSGQKMRNWKATLRNWTRREGNGRGQAPGSAGGTDRQGKGDYSFLRDTVICL
jgi:hypothetical protein